MSCKVFNFAPEQGMTAKSRDSGVPIFVAIYYRLRYIYCILRWTGGLGKCRTDGKGKLFGGLCGFPGLKVETGGTQIWWDWKKTDR